MTAATVPDAALDAVEHPTARALAARLEGLPPAERRRAAEEAIRRRRAQLALYVDVMRERYGNAPALERVLVTDDLLGELTILAYA